MRKKTMGGLCAVLLLGAVGVLTLGKQQPETSVQTNESPQVSSSPKAAKTSAELYAEVQKTAEAITTPEQREAAQKHIDEIQVSLVEKKEKYDRSIVEVKRLTREFEEASLRKDAILQNQGGPESDLEEIDDQLTALQTQLVEANEQLNTAYRNYANDFVAKATGP